MLSRACPEGIRALEKEMLERRGKGKKNDESVLLSQLTTMMSQATGGISILLDDLNERREKKDSKREEENQDDLDRREVVYVESDNEEEECENSHVQGRNEKRLQHLAMRVHDSEMKLNFGILDETDVAAVTERVALIKYILQHDIREREWQTGLWKYCQELRAFRSLPKSCRGKRPEWVCGKFGFPPSDLIFPDPPSAHWNTPEKKKKNPIMERIKEAHRNAKKRKTITDFLEPPPKVSRQMPPPPPISDLATQILQAASEKKKQEATAAAMCGRVLTPIMEEEDEKEEGERSYCPDCSDTSESPAY